MVTLRSGKNITHSDQIGDDVITGADIAADQIDSEHFAADSIDAEHIAPGAVDATAIGTDAVGADEIGAGAVGTSEVANDSIINEDIKSDAGIADSKLATITTAGKVDGSAITNLANIPAGAGQIPAANLSGYSKLAEATFNETATNDTFTADAGTDVITSTSAHNLENGDKVVLSTTGTLPAGLSATTYYVRDKTATTFKLSQTRPNNTAVNITDTGTGTHTWTLRPGSIKVSFTAKTHLKIVVISKAPTVAGNTRIQFNDDQATNYRYSIVESGGAGTNAAQTEFIGFHNNQIDMDGYIDLDIYNVATIQKIGSFKWISIKTGATTGTASHGGGGWDNTTNQITSVIAYLDSTGAFAAGSKVIVFGMD